MELLEEFRANDTHMVFVIDEYGDVLGLVTLRDLIEAVTGEFQPRNAEDAWAIARGDGSWLLDGLIPVPELKDRLDLKAVPEEEKGRYNTLSGMFMWLLGRVPQSDGQGGLGGLAPGDRGHGRAAHRQGAGHPPPGPRRRRGRGGTPALQASRDRTLAAQRPRLQPGCSPSPSPSTCAERCPAGRPGSPPPPPGGSGGARRRWRSSARAPQGCCRWAPPRTGGRSRRR